MRILSIPPVPVGGGGTTPSPMSSRDDDWMAAGACVNLAEADAMFFPPKVKGKKTDYKQAKAVCRECPVRAHCLMYAIAHKITYGVWGGLTERERVKISRDAKIRIRRMWFRGELIRFERR